MDTDHVNKVAIVTGGAQGIGTAISLTLAQARYTTIIGDIHESKLAKTLQKYPNIYGYPLDVSNEESVQQFVHQVVTRWNRIDALINNAAISQNKPIEQLSLLEWQQVINTNLTGIFLMVKHTVHYLRQSRGNILNIASTRAMMSEPHTEAYSASKGGVVALTHALAVSLGPAIRVNCISPGWIDTRDWVDYSLPPLRPIDHSQHPCGRVGKPEDVANMVQYLLSEKASFITGMNYIFDGGMTIRMIYEE